MTTETIEIGSVPAGWTRRHLLGLEDLTAEEITLVLDKAAITVNKNTVPRETQSPFVTSGIRIGTPAVTTRGLREAEMRRVASLIDRVLSAPTDDSVIASVRAEVKELTAAFPLYPTASEGEPSVVR